MNTGTGRQLLRGNPRGWRRIEHPALIWSTPEPDNTGCSPKVVTNESSHPAQSNLRVPSNSSPIDHKDEEENDNFFQAARVRLHMAQDRLFNDTKYPIISNFLQVKGRIARWRVVSSDRFVLNDRNNLLVLAPDGESTCTPGEKM